MLSLNTPSFLPLHVSWKQPMKCVSADVEIPQIPVMSLEIDLQSVLRPRTGSGDF